MASLIPLDIISSGKCHLIVCQASIFQKWYKFNNIFLLQQYFQYYQKLRMNHSSTKENTFCVDQILQSKTQGFQLNKFKPWVFRPKKMVYSLNGMPPNKKTFSTSHWTHQENNKYIEFLIKFREVIEGEKKTRRKWHLNRIMSKFVATRSHEQCRSHHQKMMKNYLSIDGVINHVYRPENRMVSNSSEERSSSGLTEEIFKEELVEESVFNILDNRMHDNSLEMEIPCLFKEQYDDLF